MSPAHLQFSPSAVKLRSRRCEAMLNLLSLSPHQVAMQSHAEQWSRPYLCAFAQLTCRSGAFVARQSRLATMRGERPALWWPNFRQFFINSSVRRGLPLSGHCCAIYLPRNGPSATYPRVCPVACAMRTASLRNSSVLPRPLISHLCYRECY